MHPRLAAMPPRFRQIVLEEVEAAEFWVGPLTFDELFAVAEQGNRGHKIRRVTKVRDVIWWRMRHEEINGRQVALARIGSWFGRDHTSVRAGIDRHPLRLHDWAAAKRKLYERQRADHTTWAATQSVHITQPTKAA